MFLSSIAWIIKCLLICRWLCNIHLAMNKAVDSNKLQQDLDSLSLWKQKWRMSFNTAKCHIMHITRSRKPIHTAYTLPVQQLSSINQVTYLGIELTSSLAWSSHINKITSKGSQSLGFLKRNIHSAKQITKDAAYNTIVRPTLEYCSSVWDLYQQKRHRQNRKHSKISS